MPFRRPCGDIVARAAVRCVLPRGDRTAPLERVDCCRSRRLPHGSPLRPSIWAAACAYGGLRVISGAAESCVSAIDVTASHHALCVGHFLNPERNLQETVAGAQLPGVWVRPQSRRQRPVSSTRRELHVACQTNIGSCSGTLRPSRRHYMFDGGEWGRQLESPPALGGLGRSLTFDHTYGCRRRDRPC